MIPDMKRVDPFLSRKAQAVWPTALVLCEETGERVGPGDRLVSERWTIERRKEGGQDLETLDLGPSFRDARQALDALLAATRARGK